MTATRPPDDVDRPDELKQRYLRASAEQEIGPSERVRQAALAHAQSAALAVGQAAQSKATTPKSPAVAANYARWNVPLVASLAIASLGALLALQFDRSDPADQQIVLSTPSATELATVPPQATLQQEKLASPALENPTASPAAPPSSPPAADRSQPVKAPAGRLVMPAPAHAPAPAPAAEPGYVPTPPLASPSALPPARNTAASKAPVARSAQIDTDESAKSPSTTAALSPPAPIADAAQGPRASARDGAGAADSSSAMKGRQAEPAALDAGPALRDAARTGQLAAVLDALPTVSTAQLNSTDSAGRTALMLATQGGHAQVVQRLVAAGADTKLKDASGQTAAQMARRLGYLQIESALTKP